MMRRNILGLLAGLVLALSAPHVMALPIQLSEAQFSSQTAGLGTLVEDFEGFPLFTTSNPFIFANGTYTGAGGGSIVNDEVFCADKDKCLTNKEILGVKTFDAFPAGTNYWGASLDFSLFTDIFDVSVSGGSGVLSVQFSPNQKSLFLGFHDSLGVTSIAIENLGTTGVGSANYSFDDITTAPSVPEPTTLALLSLGLVGLGVARKKKKT